MTAVIRGPAAVEDDFAAGDRARLLDTRLHGVVFSRQFTAPMVILPRLVQAMFKLALVVGTIEVALRLDN